MVSADHEGPLWLGTSQTFPDREIKHEFTYLRELSPAESESYRLDTALLDAMGPALTSAMTNRLLALMQHGQRIHNEGRWPDEVEARDELDRDLTAFLSAFSTFRSRITGHVASYFGDPLTAELKAEFEAAYNSRRDFRLAWELRNEDHHGAGSGSYLRVQQTRVDGDKIVNWFVDLEKLRARNNKKLLEAVTLWEGHTPALVTPLLTSVHAWCESIWLRTLRARATELFSACNRVMRLVHEVDYVGRTPLVMERLPPSIVKGEPLPLTIAVVAADKAIEMRRCVNEALSRYGSGT